MNNNNIENLRKIRNIHICMACMNSVLCGLDGAYALTTNNPKEVILYSALGLTMGSFLVHHTLKTSETITEIRKIKEKIK